ncbi:NtaA/DmoA family FMN-dependent monooxygenase [Frankia tisae]|uniref:NtaA/DmoA family FMN-dependent monooxygenase n=1 Tax=Frankia tisae TaxID=2950104 RepID=UPI0021BE5878|nr:NtaA/DmoA family FMN-dependent monooxygenase [Frankia tisae]
MARQDRLRLGALLHGVGGAVAGWRHPDVPADGGVDFDVYRHWLRTAESGRFDLVFITDTLFITADSTPQYLSQFEPVALLGALAAASEHIGLVATISTTYSEPFTIARQLATVDHISRGRAGVNIVTSASTSTALNYNRSEQDHPDHDTRYRIAAEYLEVLRGLWDSWEDGALLRDKESGAFFDRARLHTLDHRGEFFSVRGPLNIERPPQGSPVIFQAGASPAGRDFATREADGIFLGPRPLPDALAFTEDIRRQAAAAGRPDGAPVVFVAVTVFVAPTQEEAENLYREAAGLVSPQEGLGYLSLMFGQHDFGNYDLDAPFPDLGDVGHDGFQVGSRRIKEAARDNGWTLREAAMEAVTPRGEFIGTPEQIADRMQAWFEAGAVDGFMLLEAMPHGLETFVELVVPILAERDLTQREYSDGTFRESLGLPLPPNRFAKRDDDAPGGAGGRD